MKKKMINSKKYGIGKIICEVLLLSLFVAGSYASLIKYDVIKLPEIKKNTNNNLEYVENVNIGVGEKFNIFNGSYNKDNILLTSSNEDVVKVEDGLLYGISPGVTYITFEDKGIKRTVYVYVSSDNIPDRAGESNNDVFVIQYNPNGGTGTMSTTSCKTGNSCAVSGNLFKKDGYTFVGWTSSKDSNEKTYNWTGWHGTWNFKNGQYGIKDNKLVLTAKWDKNSNVGSRYTISYDANGGSGNMSSDICVYGEKCSIKSNMFTRSGYTFAGFSTVKNGQGYNWTNWKGTWRFTNGKYGIKDNKLVLYAKWNKNIDPTGTGEKFTIKYKANGGSGKMADQICYKGKVCEIKVNKYTRTDYKFIKWRTTSSTSVAGYNWTGWKGIWNFSNGQYGINNNTLTLYATWEKGNESIGEKYTIKYVPNGGKGNTQTQTCTYGEKCTIKSTDLFKRDGYKLIKWRTTSSTSVAGYNWTNWSGTWNFKNGQYGIKNNTLTLYATWEKNAGEVIDSYTVYYYANGGVGSQMPTTTCKSGQKCTIKTCAYSKNGYKFVGWTTKSNGQDDGFGWTNWKGTWNFKNGEKGITAKTLKLYARWVIGGSGEVSPTGITLDKKSGTYYTNSKNKSFNLTATVSPNNASNKTVTWSSSDTSVATVDNGKVTIKGIGNADITAKTVNNKTAVFKLNVKKQVIIIVTASQGVRMENYFHEYTSPKGNYFSQNDKTINYVVKSGSGFDFQFGDGYNKAKQIIHNYSNNKNFVEFYLIYTLSGNSASTYTCDKIKENNFYSDYANRYSNNSKTLSNEGYNIKTYITSHSPYKKQTKKEEDCNKGVRSLYKYYISNNTMKSAVNNHNNLSFIDYFSHYVKVVNLNNHKFEWVSGMYYETSDGLHWKDAKTTSGIMTIIFDSIF